MTVYNAPSGLRLRTQPSTSSGIAKLVPNGTAVTVYSISNGWAKVDGGYMSIQYLK